jgi:hypothetical protein
LPTAASAKLGCAAQPGSSGQRCHREGADVVDVQELRGDPAAVAGRGGVRGRLLLNLLTRRIPGYLDNPLRQNMWRAGHAHPGVWLVLGLVSMLYVDQTPLSAGLKSLVRVTLLLAPILVSLGFFLSVLSPKAERPTGSSA